MKGNQQYYIERLGRGEAHQSAGDANHSDGSLGRLRDIKQIVEQRLVLVVGEQVKLIQDKQHGAAAAAITWFKARKSTISHTHMINLYRKIFHLKC